MQIITTTHENLPKLTVKQFLLLFQSLRIYPPEFLEHFLDKFDLPSTVIINSHEWIVFLTEFVAIFSGARNHRCIDIFLARVAANCKYGKVQFILDLLQLNVPKLFAVEDDVLHRDDDMEVAQQFKHNLQKSIHTQLPGLVANMSYIVVSYPISSYYYLFVLNVVMLQCKRYELKLFKCIKSVMFVSLVFDASPPMQ